MSSHNYRKTEEGRKSRNKSRKENYAQTRRNAKNSGESYSKNEDLMILEHKFSDRTLSVIIGRSVQAIQIRRSRLKK